MPNTRHRTCAAFIKSNQPTVWLQQISQWGIEVNSADYFIVPQSIDSTQAVGLFVVFEELETVTKLEITYPYGKVGEGLFLPTNALLYPEVTDADLKRALLWKYQLYHPTIGLVGFEDSDKVNPANWVDYGSATPNNWGFAHQGLPQPLAIRLIQVEPPSAKDVLEDVKKGIKSKPLSEIDKNDKRTAVERIGDLLLEMLLKVLLLIGGLFGGILGGLFSFLENSGGSRPIGKEASYTPSSSGGKEGFLDRVLKRIEEKIADLEERRASELNRLMKMFDENSDEALQYALPLNSPYLNRGQQPEDTGGWQLFRQRPNFNLGGIGGGRAGASWVVGDNQYNSLREKYLAAAQREIARGEYKKAAYIYAHLLSDFGAAANVLEQGKYYREAAALYKDHLKNKESAAQCLERGGLELDAIELYKEMERDEKVGDLYKSIGQNAKAEKYYETCIDKKLKSTDFIDAARVVDEKLEDSDRAKAILLNGWQDNNNAENCLKNYFNIEAYDDNTDAAVKNVYAKHTPRDKKKSFLSVLEYINKKHPDEDLLNTSRNIAFEIVSEEASRNNPNAVFQLSSFFPTDKLLPSDSSRFLTRQNQKLVKKNSVNEIELAEDVNWEKAVMHNQQFVVFGNKGNVLRMARCSWYGDVEYYFWNTQGISSSTLVFVSNPLYTNTILVIPKGTITRKELFKNKYFNEVLNIDCPAWLETRDSNIAFNKRGEVYRFTVEGGDSTLHHYDRQGNLVQNINCTYNEECIPINYVGETVSETMVFHSDYLYNYVDKLLFSVSLSGKINTFPTDAGIRVIDSYNTYEKLIFIVGTNLGCFAAEAEKGNITFFIDTYFGQNTVPQFITILSLDVFVTARNNTILVYHYNQGYPSLKNTIETKSNIKSIIKANKHNQIAVLGEDKKLELLTVV